MGVSCRRLPCAQGLRHIDSRGRKNAIWSSFSNMLKLGGAEKQGGSVGQPPHSFALVHSI